MNRYTSTPSKTTPTAVQLLMAAMAAAVIVAITACSGEQLPPTQRPQTVDPRPMRTIEAMSSQIAALQTKAAAPEETAPTDQPSPTEKTATAHTPAKTEPKPPQTQASNTDICARHPKVQDAILQTIRSARCEGVSNAELFRIQEFRDWRKDEKINLEIEEIPLQPGDFNGLVNLKSLTMSVKDVEAGAFLGLDNLETLGLTVHANGSIAPGAYEGLKALQAMSIRISKTHSDSEATLILPDFDHLPKLQSLHLEDASTIRPEHLTKSFLQNLPELQYLEIQLTPAKEEHQESNTFLTKDLLAKNPKLKTLHIMSRGYYEAKLHLPENLFENNASLQNLLIKGTGTAIPERLLKDLQELETLKTDFIEDEVRHQIQLHKDSPLYNKIAHYDSEFQGYTVVRIGDN